MAVFHTIVKLGGGLLAHPPLFETTLAAIGAAGRERPLLIVPGGGPFADAVREIDRRIRLSDDAAHWMALLAMDQYAQLIVSRLKAAELVERPQDLSAAALLGRVQVLAPSRWLREVDPLPHSWTVTADSIAAWVAGELGAERLLLIKPPGASGRNLVDAYFWRALPPRVACVTIAADQEEALHAALRTGTAGCDPQR